MLLLELRKVRAVSPEQSALKEREAFAASLRRLRDSAGLYQKELADRLGVERSTITAYERAARFPPPEKLASIADFFQVSVDYLLGRSSDDRALDDEPAMFGDRLRALRERKELTQSELGKIISASKQTISNYENGVSSPDHDALGQLADFFGVSTDYLLGRVSETVASGEEPAKRAFGRRLKHLRKDREMTQLDLAESLGLARNTVAMYEAGEREPSFQIAQQIADIMRTTTDYLLGRTDDPRTLHDRLADAASEDPELKEFWEAFMAKRDLQLAFRAMKDLDPPTLRRVLRIIKALEEDEGGYRPDG